MQKQPDGPVKTVLLRLFELNALQQVWENAGDFLNVLDGRYQRSTQWLRVWGGPEFLGWPFWHPVGTPGWKILRSLAWLLVWAAPCLLQEADTLERQ